MKASGGHTDCQEVLYRTVFRRNPPDKTRWPAYKSAFRLPPVSQSRIDDVVAGALTWTEVDLVNIDDSSSRPLRDALEEFGIRVLYHPVRQPRHIVTALGSDRTVAPFVVLGCHGDEGRILLPELGEPIASDQPFNGLLGPDEVRRHLQLSGSFVVSIGCETGRPELAEAFLDAGAVGYFAPQEAPDGHVAFLVALLFFYELTGGMAAVEAAQRARRYDAATHMRRLWSR